MYGHQTLQLRVTILEQRFAYKTRVGAIDKTILIVVTRDDHRNGILIPGNGISYSHLESHGNPVGMGIGDTSGNGNAWEGMEITLYGNGNGNGPYFDGNKFPSADALFIA